MIALLTIDRLMDVAELAETFRGKECVDHFRFLQANNIRLMLPKETGDEVQPPAHRVDVPRGDLHGTSCPVPGCICASGQRAFGPVSRPSNSSFSQRSTPAHAIIAALSVQSCGGGMRTAKQCDCASWVSASPSALWADTPPATTSVAVD